MPWKELLRRGIALMLLVSLSACCSPLPLPAKTTDTPMPTLPVYTLAGHGLPLSVAFSADGALLASEWGDETVRVWRTSDWSLAHTLEGDVGWARLVGFTPDGSRLISAHGDCLGWPRGEEVDIRLEFWNMRDGSLVRTLPIVDDIANVYCHRALALSPDASLLVYGTDDAELFRLRSLSDGSILQTMKQEAPQPMHLRNVAFSGDGSLLATTGPGGVTVWRPADGKVRARITTTYAVVGMALSPNGANLATGGSGTVQIWRLSDGALLTTIKSPAHPLAFSPDGSLLAASAFGNPYSWDPYGGEVYLWRASDGAQVDTLEGPYGSVSALTFSSDGTWLASASHSGTIQIWSIQH